MLTEDDVKRALPATLRSSVTQNLVATINNVSTDPEFAQAVRDNFISYANIMKDGKFRTQDYVSAVTYVSYKLMGYSNQDAYFRTFPQRHAELVAKNTSAKDISSYVAMYSKGKLVNLIMEQSLVPSWVLNQDVYQKAINTQADLMLNAQSEKVRTEAANSLLTHLKKPEVKSASVHIDMTENSAMNDLKDTLTKLAAQQRELIQHGVSAREIAASRIIDEEVIDD